MITNMHFDFEPDFQRKILFIKLNQPFILTSPSQWQALKTQWCEALKAWHTPYKACLDLSLLAIPSTDPKLTAPLFRMIKFFKGFYLKKAAIVGLEYSEPLPIANLSTLTAALDHIGVRSSQRVKSIHTDNFRSLIQIENHLHDQIVEVSFSAPITLTSQSQIAALRAKLTNNLMHWHHSWCLLIDMSSITEIQEKVRTPINQMLQFFSGFYMLTALGYGPSATQLNQGIHLKCFTTKHKAMITIQRIKSQTAAIHETKDSPSANECASRPPS